KATGTACGDASSVQCDAVDTCDGAGSCEVNHASDGTFCGDAGTECVTQDTCLAGACHDNGFKSVGTACGDASSSPCDAADTCDGVGSGAGREGLEGTSCGG